jgi:hypothetical protein
MNPNRIETGSQGNVSFWADVKARHAPFDVIIDDASHDMNLTITTFNELWPHLKEGGIYMVRRKRGFGATPRRGFFFLLYCRTLTVLLCFCSCIHRYKVHRPTKTK